MAVFEDTKKEIAETVLSEIKNDPTNEDFFIRELLATAIVKNLKTGEQKVAKEHVVVKSSNEKEQEALEKAEEKLMKIPKKFSEESDSLESGQDFSKELEEINKEDARKVMTKELDDFDDDMTIGELKELEKKGFRIMYPNLKYRKPKYKNVGDVLKYVESEGGNGDGVKLVIMNFND